MQSLIGGFHLKMSICLLFLLTISIHVNGFFVKNCKVVGSLRQSNTLKVLCTRKGLYTVPEKLPYRTRVLDLSRNEISKVMNNDLVHLSFLTNLNMSHNQIKVIEENAFNNLVALQQLNLAYNKLTTIPDRLFQNLSYLTYLRLDENRIAKINPSAFLPLTSLVMLNVSGNSLHHIQEVQPLFTLPCLKDLCIRSNGFSFFQTTEVSNTSLKLKTLDLSQNPLKVFKVTSNIFPDLEVLDLAFIRGSMKWDVKDNSFFRNVNRLNLNGIKMASEEMKVLLQTFSSSLGVLKLEQIGEEKVKSLVEAACIINSPKTLQLRFNNITSLSEKELQFCTNVTMLGFSDNNVQNVSILAFRSMTKLRILNLSHNKLKAVPFAIRNISTLAILEISYNNMTTITRLDFSNLKKLLTLHVYRNDLRVVEDFAFRDLKNLRSLIISSNKLLNINGNLWFGLRKLEYLQLASNKLSWIQKGDFKYLQSLTRLDLDDNQIQIIETGAFDGLVCLKFLNLQSNKITQKSIRSSIFSGLKSLQTLQLNNNYISYVSQKRLKKPPFTSLTSLEFLSIYNQGHKGMMNIPLNFLEGLNSLRTFKARNLNIDSLHPLTFAPTPNLTFLDLSRNELISFSSEVFLPIQHLTRLSMSKIGLQSIDFLRQAKLTEIQMLTIQRNALSFINGSVIASLPNLVYLSMEGNMFSCDCNNALFISWAESDNNTQVLNADQFKCNYPPKLRGSKLIKLDLSSCIVHVGFSFFISTATSVLLTMISALLYHFLRSQAVYAYYTFLAFVYDSKWQRKQKAHSFQYDAFISYNTHDELWVMSELLPHLEGEQGWRLCLHHRDFQPGKPIIENIVDSIYGSHKTICVISRHYLESEWCSSEIQLASFRIFDEKKDILILVFLEDIPMHQLSPFHRMRRLIKKRTYLSWPKPGKDSQVFWQKLRVALETRGAEEENLIL
ncbi:toll-like receptor 13 [Colossoma macropomum]|uniref:toll-like receptor 13 n=1 Tax=Colossoma macropomum TaxID=42526 RepID=UPI001863B98E|nr:toll-like receptor 13 [Colossoma macropomum]XP_036413578.1 toll-like receptor 13 [Colossoma macropomum]XP_036413580.1 toll-like receptor 13 [Colossoma macropomum]